MVIEVEHAPYVYKSVSMLTYKMKLIKLLYMGTQGIDLMGCMYARC